MSLMSLITPQPLARARRTSRLLILSPLLTLGALGALSAQALTAAALSLAPISDEALVRRADLVVRGRVAAQRVTSEGVPEGRRWVFTYSEVEVEECLLAREKVVGDGGCPARVIVSQLGGQLPPDPAAPDAPPVTLSVPGQPLLPAGARVTLLLRLRPALKEQGAEEQRAEEQGAEGQGAAPVFVVEGGPLGARVWPQEVTQEVIQDPAAVQQKNALPFSLVEKRPAGISGAEELEAIARRVAVERAGTGAGAGAAPQPATPPAPAEVAP